MSDFEVVKAVRMLERTGFEGVSIETLQRFKILIEKVISEKTITCDHNWKLSSKHEECGISIEIYKCKLCENCYAKGG